MEDFSNSVISFLNNNQIKFIPLILENKIPQQVKLKCYKRTKKDGQVSYVPNYTEFQTITEEKLKLRQSFLDQMDFNTLGIDTYQTFQIDIDTDIIDKQTLDYMIQNFPYYKSLTKYYGFHFFIRIKDFTPPKARLQFHNYHGDDDIGQVELLCGSWGYFKLGAVIQNTDKEIPEFSIDKDFNISLEDGFTLSINHENIQQKNKANKSVLPSSTPSQHTGPSNNYQPFPIEEIEDHLLNIDAKKYISSHEHHFKICISLFKYGYDDLAYKSINLIVNPKNKDFVGILNEWKKADNTQITIATFFYYSKISNPSKYSSLLKKWRGASLPQQYRKELFQFNLITEKINQRYLPSELLLNTIKDNMEQIIHIKSHLGTGKTTIMKNYIDKNTDKKILYFAPRIAFANDIHSALKTHGFEIYTDIKKKKEDFNYEKIIIQVESLHRVKGKIYDMIVVDEIESVLKQLTSKSTNKRMTETYQVFNDLIQNTKTIVSLDAFLSQHSINMIRDIKNKPTKTDIIVNEFQPYQRKAYELKDLECLIENAKKQLDKNEKIVFVSLSKTDGDDIYNKLMNHNENLNIKYYYGSMDQYKKKFDNVEKDWGDLDVLLYTPIITCGVNFDPDIPHFHSLYIWGIPNSCVVRDVFQASLRVRKLINNDCYFAISRANYNYIWKKFNVDELGCDNIKANIIKNQKIIEEMGLAFDKLYDWGIDNLAFKLNEQLLSNHYIVEMMYEYFRLCGYELFTYSDKVDYFKQINEATKDVKPFHSILNLDSEYYKELSRNPETLTENQKWSMLKYEVCEIFRFDELDATETDLFWEFISDSDRRNNLLTETQTSIKENIKTIFTNLRKYDEWVFDVFIDPRLTQKLALQKLLKIFEKDYSYQMNFTQKDIEKHSIELMSFVEEYGSLFNIRKSRGKNPITYLTGVVKKIIGDWLKTSYKRNRISKDNARFYRYTLDLDMDCIQLYNKVC